MARAIFRSLLFFCLAFFSIKSVAQVRGRVLVQNSPDRSSVVEVKWYSTQIICPEGAIVYRRINNGSWEKLTTKPLKINTKLSEKDYPNDTTTVVFIEMLKEMPIDKIPDIAKISMMVQSFNSSSFSSFLGLYFRDTTLLPGSVAQYKIMEVAGGSERLLGVSNKITVGGFKPLAPVDSITYSIKRRTVEWKWRPEDDRYFGVVFYEKGPLDTAFKRITKNPIVVFQNENKEGKDVYPDVMFKEDSLQENACYQYKIAGVDFFGNYTSFSSIYSVQIVDSTPPPAPHDLVVRSKGVLVDLTWKRPVASEDIDYLQVFRSIKSSGPYLPIGEKLTATDTAFRDTVDRPGPYYYYVASIDLALNQGASNPAFIEVHDIIPPSQPVNLSAVSDTGKVILSWDMGKEPDLWGYYIYRTIKGSSEFALLNSAPFKGSRYLDKRPRNAKNAFLYYLVAVDSSFNNSTNSDTVAVRLPDITPPVPPKISKVVVENGVVTLYWLSNVEPDLAGYVVYKGFYPDSVNIKANEGFIPSGMVSYSDLSSSSGVVYYKIVAVDSTGNVSFPSEMVSANVTMPVVDMNITLKILKLKKRRGFVNFAWNGLPEQRGFVVYKSNDGSSYTPVSPLIAETVWTETFKRKQKTPFYLMVKGYLTSGQEVKSNCVKVPLDE